MPLIVVLGPTAVGKSAIAVELAQKLGGEIISADSVQVYKYLDIGTARISPCQQKGVPHHLLGFLEPDDAFTVAQFQKLARDKIEEIGIRKRLPFIVGGTGLYIQAVIDPYEFPTQLGLEKVRKQLRDCLEAGKHDELYAELQRIDPEAVRRIHPRDYHRITRALEVYRLTQRPISSYHIKDSAGTQRYQLVMIGLNRDREELYRRIELRVEKMFRQGLIDEVRDLIELGFNSDLKPLKTLGYKQTFGYLAGEYDLDTAISLTKQATRRYAKRQLTWFRRDPRIRWFTLTGDACHDHTCSEIEGYICRTIPIHVE